MRIKIEITEAEMKRLIQRELEKRLGTVTIRVDDIKIEVHSKQNYKAEWEIAAFRASYEGKQEE